jgi:hypothetical protein
MTITFHVAWWWKWYCTGVYMMALTTGLAPDPQKLASMAVRAITWKAAS